MRKHINATTAQARNKGLEGASPGTSASLIYTDHKGRTIEGRQSYPVRVYADGAYVGILNPGETIDTFAASRIDEIPVYKKGGKPEETNEPVYYGGLLDEVEIEGKDERSWLKKNYQNVANWGHGILDAAGMFPGLGFIPDAINTAWYGLEGDKLNAGLSAAAMIPFAGQAATAAKWANRGRKAIKNKKKADTAADVTKKTLSEADQKYAKSLGIDVKDYDDLVNQYNKSNKTYRSINIDEKAFADPEFLNAAAKAGVDVNDKIGLMKYMTTSVPYKKFGNVYTESLLKNTGDTRSFLFTSPNKQFTSTYAPQGVTAKFPLFTDDVTKLSNVELTNRLKFGSRGSEISYQSLLKNPDLGVKLPSRSRISMMPSANKPWVPKNTVQFIGNRGESLVNPSLVELMSTPDAIKNVDFKMGGKIKGSDGKACWKGYRFVGTKNGKDRCIKVMQDGTVVEQPDSGPEIVANPIDYTQYEYIPSSHFEIPTGEFTYNFRRYMGDDENGDPIFVNEERTGTHDPNWYSPDFDPYEYYKSGQYEGMDYRDTPIRDYENNPYMKNEEMSHPLVWDEDRLIKENRKRFNQSVINDIWNEDGTLKPEYEQRLGSKRYLRPFGPNYEDAPNAQTSEGRWASDWFEGARSGWGKPGSDSSWMYNEEAGTWHTFVPNVGGEAWDNGDFQDLTEKELKKLYKVYKEYPGFGDVSKKEFIERYKSGDIFHPQIAGVEQEKAWIKTFEDKVQPFKQGEFDAQKDFFDGAISSDLYREKLIAQGYENVDEIISQREAALANANMKYESTAESYADEYVSTGGGDQSGYRKGLEGEYDRHTNDIYSILDKRQIIYDLIDQGKIDISNLGKWDAHQILGMYNDYTPFGDEAPPTEHGFYTKGERDALFWSQWANKGINMSDYLNSKINEGKTGSRAYVTSPDGKTIISPRQLQQLNIDLGGEGTTEELHSFLDEVSAHELGHQMGAVNASEKVPYGLNKNDQNTIHRLMEESGVNLDDLNWHDRAAYERKADLDALRWKMYNTIGYDYRTTPMTKEILQEYKNYIKENPIPSLVNDRNFEFFKDDKLIEFNNTVADATNEIGGDDLMLMELTANARYGGPAKYQNAGNVVSDSTNVQIQSPYDIEMELIKNNFEKSFSQEDRDYINFINTRTPFRDETTTGDDPELFYLDLYNTELTAEELLEYYLWKDEMAYRRSLLNKTNIEEELHKLDMDLGAYDVQGWWKSGDYENTDTDGHGTDKWKKPNHPTFSNESKYASNYELPEGEEDTRSKYLGGTWSETGAYTPSIHNMYTNERLHWEFNREPHRPEHLYMGNDLIYNHQHFPIIYDFEKTKTLDNYEDGGGVKKQEEIPQYIEEPLTAKMQEKLDKMYRDNLGSPQDLEINTFDTSTEDGMIKYLKHTENSIMKGYDPKTDRWYPHDDGAGYMTIGYGHNINSHKKDTGYTLEELQKNGLSSAEVEDLLKYDMKRESDLIAKNVPGWEDLNTQQKNALLDIQFNIIGNVWTEFPSFTEAVVNKDWKNVVLHGSRAEFAKNPDGTFKPNQRNTAFYKSMVEPMMNAWRPKTKNPNYVEELDLSHITRIPPAVQDNTYVDMPIFPTIEIDKIEKFEDGSEVTSDPPSYNLQEYFSNNLIETTTRYPNFSDQDIYKYYLENKSPEEGFSVFFPDVSVLNEPLNELTPVPFYSSNFSTAIDTPNFYRETGTLCASNGQLIEGCAGGLQIAYEYNTPLSKDQVRNVNGIKGNAWQMHQNVVDAGGQSLFNYSNLLGIDEDWRSNNYNMSSDDLFYEFNKARNSYNPNDLSGLEGALQVGDLVDILYDGSSYQPEAIQDGFGTNINSHVGKITEKNGQLYVTHNIKGKWYSDKLDNVLNNQTYSAGGKMMIVGGYRPRYESGLIDGVSYKNRIENPVDGYNSLVSMDYLNHLGMTMPNIQGDFGFSDSDSSLVAKASYGTFGKESTFATGTRWDAKNYSRDLLRGYKGLNDQEGFTISPLHATISFLLDKKFTDGTLDMDSLSEGMTQIKLDEFVKDDHIKSLFAAYNITDPDILYTTEGSSRATALVHSLNLKLINDYFSGHDLSDQVKMNMMHMAFNKGIDNVLRDFVNDENIVTPASFQRGHDIYKNIHTNEGSYSYIPNKISSYIDYDHSKMKANSNRVANYDVESLSGFEQGYMDLMEEYEKKKEIFNQNINENKREFNTGQRKILNKVDQLIKKANKTKDIKYINKAKQKLENFSSNVNDDLKKETKTVKRGLKKIKSLFR